MTTNIAVAAQIARPVIPTVLKRTLPNKAEIHLDRIRHGEPVAHVYKGERRPWWDLVDNNKVYEALSDELFQAYVRLMTAIALVYAQHQKTLCL